MLEPWAMPQMKKRKACLLIFVCLLTSAHNFLKDNSQDCGIKMLLHMNFFLRFLLYGVSAGLLQKHSHSSRLPAPSPPHLKAPSPLQPEGPF